MSTYKISAHPVQGLTCFHQYQEPARKTLSIDMLYVAMGSYTTTTTINFHDVGLTQIENIRTGLSTVAESRVFQYLHNFTNTKVSFQTNSNYKTDVGLASSAAGFACIAGGLYQHLHSACSTNYAEISKLARLGSFSAAASVTGGMSVIRRRKIGDEPFAEEVFTPQQLNDVTIVTATSEFNKNGHDFYTEAQSSPFVEAAKISAEPLANQLIAGFETRDIDRLASLSEQHIIQNYAVLHSGSNSIFLWKPDTIRVLLKIKEMRSCGHPIFASMNTGANVFAYCFSDSATSLFIDYLKHRGISSQSSKIGEGILLGLPTRKTELSTTSSEKSASL